MTHDRPRLCGYQKISTDGMELNLLQNCCADVMCVMKELQHAKT